MIFRSLSILISSIILASCSGGSQKSPTQAWQEGVAPASNQTSIETPGNASEF